MPNPWAIYYESISEPVLPEALQPEVVELDKWWARDVRPAQHVVFFDRGYLNALVQFDALFPADIFVDSWWQPEIRPAQRAIFYIRHFLGDIQTFSDLFSAGGSPVAGPTTLTAVASRNLAAPVTSQNSLMAAASRNLAEV